MLLTWDGSHHGDNVSLGRTQFAKRMFYYSPKIYSQLGFHSSVHAARKAACSTRGRERQCSWRANTGWHKVCQPLGGNHSQTLPQRGQKHAQDRQGGGKRTAELKERCHEVWMQTWRGIHLFLAALDPWQRSQKVRSGDGSKKKKRSTNDSHSVFFNMK